MYKVKVLSGEDIEQVLKMQDVIPAVESVYRQKAHDAAVDWPTIYYEFNPGKADTDIKSGWLKGSEIFGVKLVSFFGKNAEKGIPTMVGVIVLTDANTGVPLGFLNGEYITGIRTGASCAIAVRELARPESENLLVVGTGNVALFNAAAVLTMMPHIKHVRICDPLDYNRTRNFLKDLEKRCEAIGANLSSELIFSGVTPPELANTVKDSDIIVTATPSKEPIIKKEWVKPGTHISCMGADMPGKEEIDPEITKGAVIFMDDRPQCITDGEIEIPLKKGIISEDDIAGEIGDLLIGQTEGRKDDKQITIFDSCGLALHDLATANIAVNKAEEENLGSTVEI